MKKAIVLALAVFGLMTFFLPLVRVRAPLVGTQSISGWDAAKPAPKRASRAPAGLEDTLTRLQQDSLRQRRRELPLAVRQAEALRVMLPLAYLSLLLAGLFGILRKARLLQVAALAGLLAAACSLASVFWLNSGLKEMLADAASGAPRDLLGMVRRSVAQQVEVSPEVGLYLLLLALGALLLASFLPARQS